MNEALVILLFLPLWLLPAWFERHNDNSHRWKIEMGICAFFYLFSAAVTLLYLLGMRSIEAPLDGSWNSTVVSLVMWMSSEDPNPLVLVVMPDLYMYKLDAPRWWDWLMFAYAPAMVAWEVGTMLIGKPDPESDRSS